MKRTTLQHLIMPKRIYSCGCIKGGSGDVECNEALHLWQEIGRVYQHFVTASLAYWNFAQANGPFRDQSEEIQLEAARLWQERLEKEEVYNAARERRKRHFEASYSVEE